LWGFVVVIDDLGFEVQAGEAADALQGGLQLVAGVAVAEAVVPRAAIAAPHDEAGDAQ
jgi:hypothetical protein